jgi:biuret amidohydrolase
MPTEPRIVELVDRADMIRDLNAWITLDPRTTAIVTIDMKRVHLDHAVGTHLVPRDEARRVIDGTVRLLDMARAREVAVVHVILENRGIESARRPFQEALRATGHAWTPGGPVGLRQHSLAGSAASDLVPEMGPAPTDHLVRGKRRFSAFYGTDLEILLRDLRVESLILAGVNTNTCVLNTAFEAANRDFTTVVASDCVASGYGQDLHVLGLEVVRRCFGWVLASDEIAAKLDQASAEPAGQRVAVGAGR